NAGSMLLEATGGLASRPEGFVVYLSTQSDAAPAGVFDQKLTEVRDIPDGKIADPPSLPVIYEFPRRMLEDRSFRRPENWPVTNPNLGASVYEQYLIDQLAKAERASAAEVVGFYAKHLNVQVDIALRAGGWAGAVVWARGLDETLTDLDELLARCEVVT